MFNILKSFKDLITAKKQNGKELSYTMLDNSWIQLNSNLNVTSKEPYSSFAYASINCRAEKTAESNNLLYYKTTKETKEITVHPFLDLMNSDNLYNQSIYDIKYLTSISLDLFGNSFLYVVKNRFKQPIQLIVLPANKMSFKYNANNTQIIGYILNDGLTIKEYTLDEVIHIKIPDPRNNLVGKSTISAIPFQIDTDYFQSMYNQNFYANDASVGGVLSSPSAISPENFSRLEQQLTAKKSGMQNAGKWLITENGMTASRMNASPKEANFLQSRLNLRDEIFGIFKTSKSILGYTDDVNRANAEAIRIAFIQNTIMPWSKRIQSAFTKIAKSYDLGLEVVFSYDDMKDSEEQYKDLDLMLKYGVLTKNEVRQIKGWDYREDMEPSNSNVENQPKQ